MPSQNSFPRLLIADDHALFADALRAYLERSYTVLAMVFDGRSMVKEAIRLKPDVIIVDIGMPFLNGLDAARRVRKSLPKVGLVFLTMSDDLNIAAAAAQEWGAIGFVLKHSAVTELSKAICHAMRGEPYLTPRLRQMNWFEVKTRSQQFGREMTLRQREVVQLLAEGRSIKQVADVLDVTVKTVEFHKHKVMESFNLKSNADLVLFAVKQGLIAIDQ